MEKASDKLLASATDLTAKGEDSVFAKADTEEGKEALYAPEVVPACRSRLAEISCGIVMVGDAVYIGSRIVGNSARQKRNSGQKTARCAKRFFNILRRRPIKKVYGYLRQTGGYL